MAKCQHLVGHFKHSSANTSELKRSHSSVCQPKDVMFNKLQQDVATRWNSTYMMSARMLEVKDAIMQHHIDHPKNYSGPKLTVRDKIYVSLRFTCQVLRNMLGVNNMRHVLPLEAFLHKLLMVNDDDPGFIARLKNATLKDFTNRIEGIDALPTFAPLDPRYKKLT